MKPVSLGNAVGDKTRVCEPERERAAVFSDIQTSQCGEKKERKSENKTLPEHKPCVLFGFFFACVRLPASHLQVGFSHSSDQQE